MTEQPMSNSVREQIQVYIKNGIDISGLIKDYSIKNENLSGAKIKSLAKPDCDISGCNFSNCTIGDDKIITNLNRTIARSCSFKGTVFKGEVWARRIDARHSNFTGAWLPNVDYKHADLRDCIFCDTVFCIGTERAYGALFDEKLFQDLTKFWNIEVKIKQEGMNNGGNT